MTRPAFLQTRKKYTKKMPRAVWQMFKARPRLAVATFEDDESDRKPSKQLNARRW
jgi:hypothetical protein